MAGGAVDEQRPQGRREAEVLQTPSPPTISASRRTWASSPIGLPLLARQPPPKTIWIQLPETTLRLSRILQTASNRRRSCWFPRITISRGSGGESACRPRRDSGPASAHEPGSGVSANHREGTRPGRRRPGSSLLSDIGIKATQVGGVCLSRAGDPVDRRRFVRLSERGTMESAHGVGPNALRYPGAAASGTEAGH